jgi:hypothetical protein
MSFDKFTKRLSGWPIFRRESSVELALDQREGVILG